MGSAFLVKFGNHADVKVPVSLCPRRTLRACMLQRRPAPLPERRSGTKLEKTSLSVGAFRRACLWSTQAHSVRLGHNSVLACRTVHVSPNDLPEFPSAKSLSSLLASLNDATASFSRFAD